MFALPYAILENSKVSCPEIKTRTWHSQQMLNRLMNVLPWEWGITK